MNAAAQLEQRDAKTALLVMQGFLGYEWLMSGASKIVRGGFVSGLGDELAEKSRGTVGWYQGFLDRQVIPHAGTFAVLVVAGELLVGVALLVTALLWGWRWSSRAPRAKLAVLIVAAGAGIAATLMNINFHLADGSPHPWLIPKDGFDEGVDLDSLMPLLQLVLVVVAVRAAKRLTSVRGAMARTMQGELS